MDVLEKAQRKIAALKTTVQALRQQRESIESQLLKSEHELIRLSGFLETYKELDDNPSISHLLSTAGGDRFNRMRQILRPKNIEVIAEAFLRDSAPKKTNEIVDYLESKGCVFPSENKESYLAGVLSRSNRFVARRKHGGWFLVENAPPVEHHFTMAEPTQGALAAVFATLKSETPSALTEGVSDTSNQASLDAGTDSDGLI
jgi:hypothetical protein